MPHDIATIHPNSRAAFSALNLDERAHLILAAFIEHGAPLSDRQCMRILGFQEKGMVSPRISEMSKPEVGLLEEAGDVICKETKKRVRTSRPTAKAMA